MEKNEISLEKIGELIFTVRGRRVILDNDLAFLYGTTTKRLNQQVKRNKERFPNDFMFELTKEEFSEPVTNCDRFRKLKHSSVLPRVFTEHGAVMAANVLSSKKAVEMSVYVVRAFVRMRELIAANKTILRKLDEMENRYDKQFKVVFNAIRELMVSPETKRREIGFK